MIENIKNILLELVNTKIETKDLAQRGIADKIEKICTTKIFDLQGGDIVVKEAKSKRTIEDVQVEQNMNIYKVDIKSHGVENEFSMPNLISIDRLRKFYESENNYLVYAFIDYITRDDVTTITKIEVKLVEELHWSMLAIQNLGKGQLQIKDMNNNLTFTEIDRNKWMATLKVKAVKYYDRLMEKVAIYQKDWL